MASTNAMTAIAGTNGYQQQVPIDPTQPLALSVSNASGEVRIATSSQAGVWVVVRRSDGQVDDEPDVIPVTVDVRGNTISIHPDWGVAGGFANLARKIKDHLQNGLNPSDWDLSQFRLHPDLNYDIRVEIPRELAAGSKVSAKTASGKLSVGGVSADVTAMTASGRIDLHNVTGTIVTSSASGAIAIEEANGSLEANSASGAITVAGGEAWTAVRTVSGRIEIDRFVLKNARIATVSGAVTVNGRADNALDYGFSTVSGSVKLNLALPANATATLGSKSASGSAKASGDWVGRGKRSWTLGTGEPGPALNVKTVSGSLQAFGIADPSVTLRREALPPPALVDPNDPDGVTVEGQGNHQAEGSFEGDFNIENMTNWAKDFARDFKKGFTSLATPPEPPMPPRPPMPPQDPRQANAPVDAETARVDEANARADAEIARAEAQVDAEAARHDAELARADEQAAVADEAAARADEADVHAAATGPAANQPWTWSTGSGATPPVTPTATDQQTAPIADQAPTNPAEAERLRVLEALERGDIDVEEALARLEPEDAQGA